LIDWYLYFLLFYVFLLTAPERGSDDDGQPRVKYDAYDNLGRSGKSLKPNYQQPDLYYPYGRDGAGAPRRDGNHRITTQNTGTMNKEVRR